MGVTGVPGLYASGWFGLFAPKGAPQEIIGKLNGAMTQVLADDNVRKRFTELGLDVAAREQQTRNLQDFKGGSGVAIYASSGAVLVAVIVLLILLV